MKSTNFIESKLTSTLLLMLLCLSFNTHSSEREIEIHIDDNYRPFCYIENDRPAGVYVTVLKKIFEHIPGYKLKLTPVPWQRGKKIMENGKGFALAPPYYHGHDWPYLYPYSLPIFTEKVSVFCKKDVIEKQSRDQWPKDYIGLTIGNVAGYDGWGGEEYKLLLKQNKIQTQISRGSEELIKMLILGRSDCIIMEEVAYKFTINKLRKEKSFKKIDFSNFIRAVGIGQDNVYVGYSRAARKEPYFWEFTQAFDSAVFKMQKNGEIDKLIKNFLLSTE